MTHFLSYLFFLLFIAVNVMGGARYIFRWGEPSSSPTYSSVPSEYFLVWNVITGLLVTIAFINIRKISQFAVAGYLLLLSCTLIVYWQVETAQVKGAARSIILSATLFLVLCSTVTSEWLKFSYLKKIIEVLAIIGGAFLIFQAYQYYYFDIVPAHSHKGYVIRFGSFYDDSLVLGAMLPFFAGYFFYKYSNIFSLIIVGVSFNLVAGLTGSLTAMAVSCLYTGWVYIARPVLFISYVVIGVAFTAYFSERLISLVEFKSESISLHLGGYSTLSSVTLASILGVKPLDVFTESGHLLLFLNFGLPVFVIVLTHHMFTLASCRVQIARDDTMRPIAGATEGLIFSVLLYSMNLPTIIISPVYIFVAVFSAVILKRQ